MKFDWILLERINRIILLKRISLISLAIVPILAAAWLIIKPQYKNIEQYKNTLEQIDSTIQEINLIMIDRSMDNQDISTLTAKTNLLNQTVAQLDNHIKNYQFKFPISLAFMFFASLMVVIANLIFQIGFPEELKNHNSDSYLPKAMELERTDELLEKYKTILKSNNVDLPIMPAHTSKNESKYVEYQSNIIREGAAIEFNEHKNNNFALIALCFFLYLIGIILLGIIIEKQISIVLTATF